MSEIVDVIFDYETLGGKDHNRNLSSVVELGVVCFPRSAIQGVVPNFLRIINSGIRIKFNLKSQKGIRIFDSETLAWWRSQSPDAQKILKASSEDVSVEQGHSELLEYLKTNGVDRRSNIWCRGMDFDFPILTNCLESTGKDLSIMPKFWKRRDVRTRIETLLGDNVIYCPLPLGVLDGFIKHNGIHDCAKDVMMMCYAYRYAFDMEDLPSKENTDPKSLPTH